MNIVFDIETDGLLDSLTKVHCMAYVDVDDPSETVRLAHGQHEITEIFKRTDIAIGHHIIGFDIPALEKVYGTSINCKLVDTYWLSSYLWYSRPRHGLAHWGEDFGIPKPKVDDWENLTIEEYDHRCTEDVKINLQLWKIILDKLSLLYKGDPDNLDRFVEYTTFKGQLARQQELQGWHLDIEGAKALQKELSEEKSKKFDQLSYAMPLKVNYVERKKPSVMFKACGSLTVAGKRWYDLLADQGLPQNTEGPIKVVKDREAGNPDGHQQLKDWLFSLGWQPATFDYKKTKEGTTREIPQVRTASKELCPSVLKLAELDPAIHLLDGYTVVAHRLGIVNSFLSNVRKDGKLTAVLKGLTNTLRFTHAAPLVNLPGVDKPYGKEIRGLLLAPEGQVLCGTDMTSLESTTKRHYMYPLDPEYCDEMAADDFDEHIDLAKFAGAVTEAQVLSGGQEVKAIRKKYKAANYACVYGVGAPTLSRSTGLPVSEAGELIKAYWQRNWAVKNVTDSIRVRKLPASKKMYSEETMWVWNPVSRFWTYLKKEKDVWSTINQSTGVYCFDTWVSYVVERGVLPIGQFHDEVILICDADKQEELTKIQEEAMLLTNKSLDLNVRLDCEVQYGSSYADIH